MRHLLFIAALISTGLLPGGEPAEAIAAVGPVAMAPVSHVAVDSALLDAVRAEFPQPGVRIRLAPAAIAADGGPVQREVSAHGRVLLGGAGDWVPFEVTALYDIDSGTATTTSLDLESDAVAARTATPDLARKLQVAASRKLRAEFADQPADIELARVQVREAGDYLAVLADGKADFGAEGAADATVRALYDPRNGQWLRVDYDLADGG